MNIVLLLPVRSMREGYAFVSVYMCVDKKHACLHLTARKSPQKHSLQLLHRIYSPMKTFYVLASLVRAANLWLSKATSLYGIVGVSPNLLSICRCPHSVSHVSVRQSSSEPLNFLRPIGYSYGIRLS